MQRRLRQCQSLQDLCSAVPHGLGGRVPPNTCSHSVHQHLFADRLFEILGAPAWRAAARASIFLSSEQDHQNMDIPGLGRHHEAADTLVQARKASRYCYILSSFPYVGSLKEHSGFLPSRRRAMVHQAGAVEGKMLKEFGSSGLEFERVNAANA